MVGNRQLQMLFLTTLVVFFGWSSMWPIMAYYIQTLGVPLTHVAACTAYVMLVVGIVQTLSVPWLGKLGDRVGRSVSLVWSTLGSGLFICRTRSCRATGSSSACAWRPPRSAAA